MNSYLPIGTVVMLKETTKRLMIIGYKSVLIGSDVIYDYSGCMYPEGLIDSSKAYLFNNNQIVKIYNKGFVDEEQEDFMKNFIN